MSTDSTELTFIRCPSCRSLVPAVSPRCRMCGAVLDSGKSENSASGEDSATSSRKVAPRVRQQTVLVPDQDLQAAKGAMSDSSYESPVFADPPKTKKPFGKPVSAPIQQSVSAEEEAGQIEDDLSNDQDELDSKSHTDFGDPLGAFIEEVPVEESLSVAPESSDMDPLNLTESQPSNGNGYHYDTPLSAEAEIEEQVQPEEPEEKQPVLKSRSVEVKNEQESQPPPARPKIVIETGGRKSSAGKMGLSFGKPRSEPVPVSRQPVAEAEISREIRSDSEARPVARDLSEKSEIAVADKQIVAASQERAVSSMKPVDASVKSKLYGWLVSYADPKGIATELRDGKFFVSRSSLKGSDLILDDDSISTPHALVGVNVSEGLVVQDLMSDRGVFVRKKSSGAYQRVLENTRLEHGDWVRFGDIEFLVTIIP